MDGFAVEIRKYERAMANIAPVAVIIPTYNRGSAVLSVLEKLEECEPKPSKIMVHIDSADGGLEDALKRRFPDAKVLTSSIRLGPGGGRHQCLLECTEPYAVSFDDDSYPVDPDFFLRVVELFSKYPRAAIFGATIQYPYETEQVQTEQVNCRPGYIGCGYAIRISAYRQVRGHLPRPVAYGMEETDLSLQLFAIGWELYKAGGLRVVHDMDVRHHQAPAVTSGVIANVGLFAFLHYPVFACGLGFMQIANTIVYCVRVGRIRGIISGLLTIPLDCYRYRQYRSPVSWQTLKRFRQLRRGDSCEHGNR
jgi:glycosyltransferase involved in cell wall biosynthesis